MRRAIVNVEERRGEKSRVEEKKIRGAGSKLQFVFTSKIETRSSKVAMFYSLCLPSQFLPCDTA